MAYKSKYTGKQVDDLLTRIEEGDLDITIDTELSPDSSNAIANSVVTNALYNKADTDGYYPAMTVGKAENLVGRGESTEEVFSFRPSAGSLSIADGSAKITAIKGNSVVWNQLYKIGTNWTNVIRASAVRDGNHITISAVENQAKAATYSTPLITAGHKVVIEIEAAVYGSALFGVYRGDGNSHAHMTTLEGDGSLKTYKIIQLQTIAETLGFFIPTAGDSVEFDERSIKLTDLTQMFGAGNEPTSYEDYLQHKPMNIANEYAYNEGTLVDMRVNEIKSVGDNAYNPELGYARVLGGKEYNIYFSIEGLYEMYFSRTLEEDKEPIDAISNPMTFPADGYVWIMGMNGEPLYSDNVCICLQHSYPKPVIPYVQDVKDLSFISELFPNGMRSAGNVCDEIRYDKATQKWQKIERVGVRAYEEGDAENSDVTTDGVTTYYALANPKPEDLDIDLTPYYEIWDFGTEEAIASGASTPFRADIIYQFNAVDRIRNNSTKIEEFGTKINKNTADIATKQNTLTLSVKDNGNIVIGNIDGQSKEFMPATPSGDPMHKMYEAVGAVWNANTSYWEFYDMTDITNEQMRSSVVRGYISSAESEPLIGSSRGTISMIRFNLPRLGGSNVNWNMATFARYNSKLEVLNLTNFKGVKTAFKDMLNYAGDLTNAFNGCTQLRKVYGIVYCSSVSNTTDAFKGCGSLDEIWISKLKTSISFADSPLSVESATYLLQNANSTEQFTVTFRADRQAIYEANAEFVTAKSGKPNITIMYQ